MPDGRGATLLEDLPEEIIDTILTRLPSKDVGRCRAVSASWRSATSTPEFMLRHHRRQPSLPIIDGRGMVVALGAGVLWPFLPGAKHRDKVRLRGACDGLLAVSWGSRSYVCNPVIRKHALLPQPQIHQNQIGFAQDVDNAIIGFYHHHPTRELRVLWVSQHLHKYSLYILTLGSDRPRHVEVRLPTASPYSMEHKLLAVLFCSIHFPVVDHGNLHWHPYCATYLTGVDEQIIVFDTQVESFRWMPCPPRMSYNLKLFNMKGRLAFSGSSRYPDTGVDVWVMQDYDAEIWAFKYRIDLSVVDQAPFKREKQIPLNSRVKWMRGIASMAALDDGELLGMFDARHALRCDIDGRFLGLVNVGTGQYCMEFTQLRLKESIIPFPYHAMQGEDGEEEPFSIEHV
ncbi:uncharacterized protein LOC124690877 [Lolium rigidum]|uniref:uncharacterized protein LOC124690877 n=1 Tax=Lolium rigidum TaxID=89674 RepID=UPI001F5C1F5C|nr:uncharacterized protein LOC124690877 [Lolium rigidum]